MREQAFTITKAQWEYMLPVLSIKQKMLRRLDKDHSKITYSFIGTKEEYKDFLNRCAFL